MKQDLVILPERHILIVRHLLANGHDSTCDGGNLSCVGERDAAGVLEGLRLADGLLLPFVLWPCSALLMVAAQIGGKERDLLNKKKIERAFG